MLRRNGDAGKATLFLFRLASVVLLPPLLLCASAPNDARFFSPNLVGAVAAVENRSSREEREASGASSLTLLLSVMG